MHKIIQKTTVLFLATLLLAPLNLLAPVPIHAAAPLADSSIISSAIKIMPSQAIVEVKMAEKQQLVLAKEAFCLAGNISGGNLVQNAALGVMLNQPAGCFSLIPEGTVVAEGLKVRPLAVKTPKIEVAVPRFFYTVTGSASAPFEPSRSALPFLALGLVVVSWYLFRRLDNRVAKPIQAVVRLTPDLYRLQILRC